MEEKTYSLREMAQFTGLTERTLRNYLEQGLFCGEKQNGAWRFTAQQLEALLENPAVRPSIQAKSAAYVYDFLRNEKKDEDAICAIVDLCATEEEANAVSRFFCHNVGAAAEDGGTHFRFSFANGHVRVVLTGPGRQVAALLQQFYTETEAPA